MTTSHGRTARPGVRLIAAESTPHEAISVGAATYYWDRSGAFGAERACPSPRSSRGLHSPHRRPR